MKICPETLIIYAGFPKTASMWLKSSVWNAPQSGFSLISNSKEIASDFILNNPLDFDPNETFKKYEKSIDFCRKQGCMPVLHHEGIAAQLFSASPVNKIALEQLASTFPQSKIIITIREQRQLIMSWYRHNVRLGLGVSLAEYLREISPGVTPYFRYDMFEFHKIIDLLFKLYGNKNVLVLPYELLKYDCERYLENIFNFTGAKTIKFIPDNKKVNVGLKLIEILMLSQANRLFITEHPIPRPTNFSKKQVAKVIRYLSYFFPERVDEKIKLSMENIISDRVQERYNQGNQILQGQIGFDLGRYGYAL